MNPGSERRRHQRVTIVQELLFGDRSRRKADDISEDGMFIVTHDQYLEHSVIDLSFRLFDEAEPIAVRAEVLHCQPHGMGVKFVDLKPTDRERIRRFIHKLDHRSA